MELKGLDSSLPWKFDALQSNVNYLRNIGNCKISQLHLRNVYAISI